MGRHSRLNCGDQDAFAIAPSLIGSSSYVPPNAAEPSDGRRWIDADGSFGTKRSWVHSRHQTEFGQVSVGLPAGSRPPTSLRAGLPAATPRGGDGIVVGKHDRAVEACAQVGRACVAPVAGPRAWDEVVTSRPCRVAR